MDVLRQDKGRATGNLDLRENLVQSVDGVLRRGRVEELGVALTLIARVV